SSINTAVTPIVKICASLRFLATGSYQLSVGNDMVIGLSQPMVSKVLTEFVTIMESKICPIWIRSKMTQAEKRDARRAFYEKSGIPSVIQAIDGTHIKIIAPAPNIRHLYCNRKGWFSLNTLIACDHEWVIRFIDARYPGSNHDSFIWSVSDMRQSFINVYERGERNSFVLGDAGFPLEPCLLVPYRNADAGSREAVFNHKHSQARSVVERTIGILKSRFRCLLGARQLHYSPSKASSIVNACAALHNICRGYNMPDPEIDAAIDSDVAAYTYDGPDEASTVTIRDHMRDCL
ncbi:LOW QUALITY PROTEIN: putative nuclease HARBI1, partial [Anopheles albimanus]